MDHNNDKTMYGLYRGYRENIDEPNSRRDYRIKFEENLNPKTFKKSKRFFSLSIFPTLYFKSEKSNFTDDATDYFFDGNRNKEKKERDDENYFYILTKYFPESKLADKFMECISFGMNSYDKKCDCCAKQLNILNGTGYGVCMKCNEDLQNTQKSYGENKHIRELILGF